MKTILILSVVLICYSVLKAQNNLTIHAGLKFIEYRGNNIQFYYRDESPAPDDFYTDIELKGTTIYNIGGNFNNYTHGNNFYWDLSANLFFGSYFGMDIGGTLGYPLFINKNNSISFLPNVTACGGFYNMSLGTLENKTTFITVNETQFQNYTNVDLSLSGFYLFLKPTMTFIFDLTRKVQLRFSGSYLVNIDLDPDINFNGKNQNGGEVSDSEKLAESNLAFFIDGKRTQDSPFKLSGLEARIGISFNIGE